jgi:heme exporter protein A
VNVTRVFLKAPALSARDVSIERDGRIVISRATFDLGAGETVLLKGPNGSGKTSLLRAVAGLLPFSGSVTLDNGQSAASAVVYCAHADGVKTAMTVRRNVRFWAALHGATPSDADAALHVFALADLSHRPASTLSAGQRRRLGLTRLVIACRPIWLLDEPTASMDAASVELFLGLAANHCRNGGSALIATHEALKMQTARALRLETVA